MKSITNSLSIIVPTWNEEGNVELLTKRIDDTMSAHNIAYELIFIDDHSTDGTVKTLERLRGGDYPIRIYSKQRQKGKAQSLLEGFAKAKYKLICMIDADLQYPPEAIPEMYEKIRKGADIVVANRKQLETSFFRSFISRAFMYLFANVLHGIKFDVQSGLKLFKKEIIERIEIHAVLWSFDMEFLIKARSGGYKIASYDIKFAARNSGSAKINILKASWEIGWSALRLKFNKTLVVPFHRNLSKVKGKGFHYNGAEFVHHTDLHNNETAFYRFSSPQIIFLCSFVLILGLALYLNWHATILVFFSALTLIYLLDIVFNMFLIYKSFTKSSEIKISKQELSIERNWPKYTIFCPLYKEWQVVPQFVDAMSRLDYPKDKLQIVLLLEEDDKETISRTGPENLPSYAQVVVVPHSMPKTKPKACNYGLSSAEGEYVVIYDAEDVPDPDQLKKAVIAFEKSDKQIACIQAKLNFYNPRQNLLTRIFTAEYSLWFDLVLTGLQSIQGPIPLGGTSNHFKKSGLMELKGWDAFNVTEDCDLGIRLAKNGYRTAIVDSTTWEEANSNVWNWLRQRSRWIKGYIQTYLVHMRDPWKFINLSQYLHLFIFQLVVGGKVLSMFINPLMWIITISYFMFRPVVGDFIESFFPPVILYIGVFSLICGNFLYLYYYMIGCTKRGYDDLVKYTIFVPLYWLGMSFAAWRAVYEMIVMPHYWAKTIHGLHLPKNEILITEKENA